MTVTKRRDSIWRFVCNQLRLVRVALSLVLTLAAVTALTIGVVLTLQTFIGPLAAGPINRSIEGTPYAGSRP